MSSKPRYTAEQRIAILHQEHRHRSHSWYNLCLMLVTQTSGFAYGPESASAFLRLTPSKFKHYGILPKRGDIVGWETNGWGHIATAVDPRFVLCNDDRGNVSRISLNYYAGLGRFCVIPGNAPVWGNSGGISPLKPPTAAPPIVVPKPAPTPVPILPADDTAVWPLLPGREYKRVLKLKQKFGLPANGRHYGNVLLDRVVAWEKAHGYMPNGKIGPREFAEMMLG